MTPGLWFVDAPGSTQTAIRVSARGPNGTDPGRNAAELARLVLGGSFTSRLNQKLREEKGYTYGASVRVTSWSDQGMVSASSSVRGAATAAALRDLLDVLASARDDGFTDAEVDRARAQGLTRLVDSAESRAGLAAAYAAELNQARDPMSIATAGDSIVVVDGAQMQAATRQYLDPDKATILLVGDRAAVLPQLEAKGFVKWTFLDKEGNPVP
jgi:predicted Zn-dependent peptidase